jgi:hypothetical protein
MKLWLMALAGIILTVNAYGSEIKELLIVGDGLTKNAPMPELGWNSNWGMAATSDDNDYAHLLFTIVKHACPGARLTLENIMYEDTMTGWTHLVPNTADVIIIQLGDNYQGGVSSEEYQAAYRQMIEELRGGLPKMVICIGPWSNEKIEPFIEKAAKAEGAEFISLRSIARDQANHASADGVYPKLANRPGDRGMKLIADTVWTALSKKYPNNK